MCSLKEKPGYKEPLVTPIELTLALLLGTLCGTIQATSPLSHSVYEKHDELNYRLQVACIELKGRDRYIQEYTLEEFIQK